MRKRGQKRHWKEKWREESQLEGGKTEKRKVVEESVEHQVWRGTEQLSMVLTSYCGRNSAHSGHGQAIYILPVFLVFLSSFFLWASDAY